jgi:hypothetical protein
VVQRRAPTRAAGSAAFIRRLCDSVSNHPGAEAIGGRLEPIRDVGVPKVIVETNDGDKI